METITELIEYYKAQRKMDARDTFRAIELFMAATIEALSELDDRVRSTELAIQWHDDRIGEPK